MKTITVIGSGYVGLTLAGVLANSGYKVFALDVDKRKIDIIKSGKSHFYEVGLDDLISSGVKSGNLIPTLSYEESIPKSSVVFSCVGTPDKKDGSSNLEYIFSAAEGFAKFAKQNAIYVQKSTVPVGTGRNIIDLIKKTNPKLAFEYVSNPEFLREGSALFDTLNMDRIVVGGSSKKALKIVAGLHKEIAALAQNMDQVSISKFAQVYKKNLNHYSYENFDERIIETNLESAELIKVTANAFLSLKISFANSIAMLCDKTGADVSEVMNGVGADDRIGRSFLYAGLGYGGGCFPKDVSGLIKTSEQYGVDQKIMKSAVRINDEILDFVFDKVVNLKPKKVGVLGLAFKPGTSDVRKSPAVRLVNKLCEAGLEVIAYDPRANEEASHDLKKPEVCTDDYNEAFLKSDVIIIATDWPEFKKYNWKTLKTIMRGNSIVDGRNLLDKEKMAKLGFEYWGVGRR